MNKTNEKIKEGIVVNPEEKEIQYYFCERHQNTMCRKCVDLLMQKTREIEKKGKKEP